MSANKELKYGTRLHTVVLQALRARVRLAKDKLGSYYERMALDEALFHAYIKEEDYHELSCRIKDPATLGAGKDFKEIYVPYSYAILMTMHTYMTSVFLGRTPVFQYTGRHGESMQQNQVMEALIDYQVNVGSNLPILYNWLLDPGKYGFGAIGVYWADEYENVSRIVEKPKEYLGVPIPGTSQKVRQTAKIPGYSGNKLYNIRPQDFIFDPRVPLTKFQTGEFAGRYVELGWNQIVKGEESGKYYNADQLKKSLGINKGNGSNSGFSDSELRDLGAGIEELPELQGPSPASDITSVDYGGLYELVVELIPADWKLGKSKAPEKWVFTFADKHGVIIESRPLGAYHAKYPYQVMPYEIDAYSISPRSMLTIAKPLNDLMTWLINTHFYSVRRVLNDQIVYDPSKIVASDMLSTEPGRLLRLKPEAYGSDPRAAIHQLNTHDATQQHLKDIGIIGEMLQRVTGVTENIMGMVNPGGRKTATEIRTSSSFGVNRLKTLAEYQSAVGFNPLAQMLVQNTQQYYSGEKTYKVAGDLMNPGSPQMIQATPENIQGFFDFVPVDGTMPIDRFAQVTMWTQLLGMVKQMPEVGQKYDMGGIFGWVAKLAGLKNIDQFKINVIPDDGLTGGVDGSNLVPIPQGVSDGTDGTNSRTNSGTAGSGDSVEGSVPGAAVSPGVGPVG